MNDEDLEESVRVRLRAWRKARGKTLAQVARDVGLDRSAFGKYESGVRRMTVRMAQQTAKSLGLTTRIEFTDEDSVPADSLRLRGVERQLSSAEAEIVGLLLDALPAMSDWQREVLEFQFKAQSEGK